MTVPQPLPGFDEAYLAAGEQQALVRWLTGRAGLTESEALAEVAGLDDEMRVGMDIDAQAHLADHDCCQCCGEVGGNC
ncbi:MAG: hypothetical protein ACRDSN_12700 [Pseudonocardiaceae bacterium]